MVGNNNHRPEPLVPVSHSTVSSNPTTFLCFLGALATLLAALCMVSVGLFEVCHIALNTMKNIGEPGKVSFCCDAQVAGKMNCSHGQTLSVTWHFK